MSFPESQRIVFRENPLVEVICQLSFPSILAIAAELPADFQERIRDRYPLYERSDGVPNLPPELTRIISELPLPVALDAVTHRFANESGSEVITLAREFVAVAVTDYTRWEDFRSEVERAKTALEAVYRPAFYTRIGLRYRDVVDRESIGLEETPWKELLNTALLGVLGAEASIRDGVRAARGEALIELAAPPASFVRLAHGLMDQADHQSYAVDADWFTEERRNPDDVFEVLAGLNRQAGDLFRWAITPRLRDALGSRDD